MMEQQNYQYQDNSVFVQEKSVSKKFFANVFLLMFLAMAISATTAYFFSPYGSLQTYLFNSTGGLSIFGWVAAFAPLGLVLLMGVGVMSRLSYSALLIFFILFSLIMGVSLSFLSYTYTNASIFSCFAAAGGIFGIMAFLGYTTDVDLSKYGPILLVGVAGLFITGILNIFIQSEQFSLIRAFIGVAVFTALTAYDVQMIKKMGMGLERNGESLDGADTKKLAIMAAISLYLDFINIFIFLLRIFGGRK